MRNFIAAGMALALAGTAGSVALAQADHAGHAAHDPALTKAVADPGRSAADKARDQYRHPAETLAFFGIKPTDTVVELSPGGGWYTVILGRYLDAGTLYASAPPSAGRDALQARLAADPVLAKVRFAGFPAGADDVPDNSVDTVLTFRNIHNWVMGGKGAEKDVFASAFRMLKPGGTLGIVEHRLPEEMDSAREKSSGYLKVSTVRRVAEAAGFEYVGASEVNANPKDTHDYENGVWTLPPTFRLGDTDRAKYAAIGESDRMTLKFRKPAQ
ncbi:class I SAM-dependent methyltransferase [Sphingomonas flavalba]|uniref:class I SAM-dependent methyltransferase n=1 Tax=Sphingomonas flavalba TaxID=2559804 RepID=UPI0039E0C546